MIHQILLALLVAVACADHQKYPGTSTRPILSDAEAAKYTKQAYLQGWTPGAIQTNKADYTVGKGGYSTIQAAVNAAIKAGGTTRKYIRVLPGTYKQAVLIPKTTVPITIHGTQGKPTDVHIILPIGANWNGAKYAQTVNPNGAYYKNGDPAWNMFNGCAQRPSIGNCAAVVFAENDNFEMAYIKVENPSLDGQALAARVEGDKQNFDHVHFYGFQDTLLASGKRLYFKSPTIYGDVDFVFGGASAVFEGAQIVIRGDRPRNTGVIFAPNTPSTQKYGFLVINSRITADNNVKANKGGALARSWTSASNPYSTGQLVIRETEIADVLKVNAPYNPSTGGVRPFKGNAATNRNLDDVNYNRFWEYKNKGAGA